MAEITAEASSAGSSVKPKALAKADKHIWGIFIALCLISVIELYSASSREVANSSLGVIGPIVRHLFMLGLGYLGKDRAKADKYFAQVAAMDCCHQGAFFIPGRDR